MKETEFAGYINSVQIGNKLYKLQCEVIEVYPMTCPKCGASMELQYGQGHYPYCNTHYTTKFSIQEIPNIE